MKTKKVLLGSLVLASVVSACTDENIVDGVQNNVPLTERTQVNLTLSAPEVDSRMSAGSGWQSNMEGHDVLGAVLVDGGYAQSGTHVWNNVKWSVVDGHVGNNKWAYNKDEGKFKTEGTTAIGSWLFYTKYNEKMTTTRNGVEFDFPQIQEGAANLAWAMNNNANFMISPVAHIDGYEGQNLDFEVKIASVFNYLRMPFDLKATGATKVQKIIVKANSDASTKVKFPTQYKVVNKNIPEAKLSEASTLEEIKCPDYDVPANGVDVNDLNKQMAAAYDTLVYATSLYTTTTGTGESAVTTVNWDNMATGFNSVVTSRNAATDVDYLVVDLDGEHTDKAGNGGLAVAADGKFSAVMLMPAGVYYSLTFDIYTDKGVYTKTITDNNAYRVNANGTKTTGDEGYIAAAGENKIFLRPGRVAVLSDIRGAVAGSNYAETLTADEYIKVAADEKLADAQYITKTADLINFINGIVAKGGHNVNVMAQAAIGGGANDDELIPEHAVIVNQAVMTAIEAKETELAGDIQINLVGATVKVKGNDAAASALNIHDLTFSNGAELVSGYVKATESVNVPAEHKMLVKNGVNLELALAQATDDVFNSLEVENGAIVKATATATVGNLLNKGTFSIAADKTIASATVENKGTATVEGTWNVSEVLTNAAYASLTNKGEMTLAGKATNNGTLTNEKDINVHGAMTNNSNVTIAANAKIHVNSSATASLLNNGTMTNSGMLYTKVGYNNTITNLGIIDAKSGSTTYITKNSKADEKTTATNASAQVMGTLKIAERNLDVTVTTPNYQGYIQYEAVAADIVNGEFDVTETPAMMKDKFNKVIFSSAVSLTADADDRVKYIVTSKDLALDDDAHIQEVTFTGNASLYGEKAKIASLTINDGVLVKVPTENIIGVYAATGATSTTAVEIHNEGELLVGGDLYTTILGKAYTTGGGEFSAGDGNATAFHWGATSFEAASADIAVVSDLNSLTTALANGKNVQLANDLTIASQLSIGSDANIDLNGKTLTCNGLNGGYYLDVKNGAKLTVVGGKIITTVHNDCPILVRAGGEAVVNCEIESASNGIRLYGGKLTVNGGTYKSTNATGQAIRADLNGSSLYINGGTFEGKWAGLYMYNLQSGEVVIKDATFKGNHNVFGGGTQPAGQDWYGGDIVFDVVKNVTISDCTLSTQYIHSETTGESIINGEVIETTGNVYTTLFAE